MCFFSDMVPSYSLGVCHSDVPITSYLMKYQFVFQHATIDQTYVQMSSFSCFLDTWMYFCIKIDYPVFCSCRDQLGTVRLAQMCLLKLHDLTALCKMCLSVLREVSVCVCVCVCVCISTCVCLFVNACVL